LFGIGGCKLLICFRISGAIQIISLARDKGECTGVGSEVLF